MQITDAMLHPQTPSALLHNVKVPWATFRKTFPLYMSISLVPYVVSDLALLSLACHILVPLLHMLKVLPLASKLPVKGLIFELPASPRTFSCLIQL